MNQEHVPTLDKLNLLPSQKQYGSGISELTMGVLNTKIQSSHGGKRLEMLLHRISGFMQCLQQSGNGFINSVGPKFFLKNSKVCTKTLTIHRSRANGDVSEINGDGVKDADDFVWHAHVVLVLVPWLQSQ